jgi:CelD/BcsL family acetyltransferase involved in cellulose biosynthesis/GNAT superfamily N-acetyltransferase
MIPPNQLSRKTITSYVITSVTDIEAALLEYPLNQWEELLRQDPSATIFQSPVWCLPWYQSYVDFDPRVLVVLRGNELVGVVPLAIERSTGRLTFGGDNMTDYRDIVTRPEYRYDVVIELLRFYKRGCFPNALHFGSTLPESDTPATLASAASSTGVRALLRFNYGWRWHPHEQAEDPVKKKSVRYPLNYFRRQGHLEAENVRTEEDWKKFKEDFYEQHSLRQIYSGRPISFDNPSKRAFFDRLFRTPYGHVTALRWNGALIAGHIGAVYNDVLYWGAPSFDIRYRQYSPNLLLLVLTMKNSGMWGFTGIDLTIGKGDLKERFSTSRVVLPWVELYARPQQFYSRKLKKSVVEIARGIIARISGEHTWEKRVKPNVEYLSAKVSRIQQLGLAASMMRAVRLAASCIGEYTRGLVLIARPEDLCPVEPRLEPGEICTYHDNELRDFLRRDRWDDEAAREIAVNVNRFSEVLRSGRTYHTVLINGRLAGWGISYWPNEPARLTEVGGPPLEFAAESVSLYNFYTVPEFRGRKLYQALLTYIVKKRFSEGAKQAYITVLEKNAASHVAIERVGFRAVTINTVKRIFKWKKLKSQQV